MWTIFVVLYTMVLMVLAGSTAPIRAKPAWKLRVVKVAMLNSRRLAPPAAPTLRGRVVEPLVIEPPEAPESSIVVVVRLANASRVARTLRWEVSHSPFLALPDGKTVWPIGHRLYGLSENALAVRGLLEVDVPPKRSYELHPVFVLERIPAGTKLVMDGVGRVGVPRP